MDLSLMDTNSNQELQLEEVTVTHINMGPAGDMGPNGDMQPAGDMGPTKDICMIQVLKIQKFLSIQIFPFQCNVCGKEMRADNISKHRELHKDTRAVLMCGKNGCQYITTSTKRTDTMKKHQESSSCPM